MPQDQPNTAGAAVAVRRPDDRPAGSAGAEAAVRDCVSRAEQDHKGGFRNPNRHAAVLGNSATSNFLQRAGAAAVRSVRTG